MTKDLYTEINNVGGLRRALDIEFEKLKSHLRCSTDENLDRMPFSYARVENKTRFSQIYLAKNEKLYLPDFWRDGVCLGHGKVDSVSKLAEVLQFWLTTDSTTKILKDKFPFVQPNEKANAFDENNEVEYAWNRILNDSSRKDIKTFVELAIKDNVIGKLFPFTSLATLCFSRCTGFPYTYDTPIVVPIAGDNFEVRMADQTVIGRGVAKEALKMVKDNLPDDIKPAVKGTAEDLSVS